MDAQSAWWKGWLVLPGHCLRRSGSDTTLLGIAEGVAALPELNR